MNIQELWENIRRLFEPLLDEGHEINIERPYPNEHAARVRDPGLFIASTFRRKEIADGISAIMGKLKSDGQSGSMTIQAYRFSKDKFTPEQAKKWLSDHDVKIISFEAATDEKKKTIQVTLPTVTRSFTITRDTQGIPRWLMIAASAVVNKVGAIDSTILFDNFVKHATENNEYPVLDFLHEGERVRFGVADWLKRDGALYLASGGFDDTELARAAIAGLESQADYWGASIAYRVMQAPLMLQAEGSIPVYTDGVNNFISIVPKRLAANLFTATLIAEEVRRMDKRTYEELVKLIGEERAKQFADQVDDANRTIEDTGMVTRSGDAPPVAAPAPEVAPVAPMAEAAPVAPVIEIRQEPEVRRVDLDALAATVAALSERLAKLEQAVAGDGEMMEESRKTQQRALDDKLSDMASRLAGVEASKERWDTWLNDAPEHIKQDAEKIFRARNQEQAPMTLEQIAAQSTAKMNRGPHFSRQH